MSELAVRRESVFLGIHDELTPGLLKSAAAAAVLDRELGKLSGRSVQTSRDMKQAETGAAAFTRSLESNGRSIDKYSGRLQLLGRSVAALGPGLVPIGAVGIPAIAGLASSLGFAAVGVGTTVVAFHGLGDALTKFNKASLDPTATNIAAAQKAMDKIAPSAQEFVLQLHKLGPELKKVQESAAGGLFPGLTEGIDKAQRALPIIEKIFRGVGGEIGNLGAAAGKSFGGKDWRPFLQFVEKEAPQALDDLGRATGAMVHGLAGLWMAFTPTNHQFSAWMVNAARDFDQWASGLSKTQGFQDFLAYIDTNGPKVGQLLGDIGSMLGDIVSAAAPLGGPVLTALDGIAKAVSLVASSPLGTPLLALLQISSVLKLVNLGLGKVGVGATVGFNGITRQAAGATGSVGRLNAELASLGGTLRTIGGNVGKNAAHGTPLLAGVNKEGIANLAKGTAMAAGLAVVMSGAADKIGMASTASDALLGAMVGGVPGAIAGGVVGAISDYHDAAKQAASISTDLASAMQSSAGNIVAQYDAIQTAHDRLAATYEGQSHNGFAAFLHGVTHPIEATNYVASAMDDQSWVQDARDSAGQAAVQFDDTKTAVEGLAKALGNKTMFKDPFGRDINPSLEQLQHIVDRTQPAMQALGYTFEDLSKMGPKAFAAANRQIVAWINHADSAKGRTKAVADAFAAMSDQSISTADRVKGLSDALDALLSPGMNLSATADAMHQGLNDLDKGLAKSTKSLRGFTDGAIQNRSAVRDQVSKISDWIKAEAAHHVPAAKMTADLKAQRQALINAGAAAGLSRGEVSHYLDTLGLTPKMVKTVIKQIGAEASRAAVHALAVEMAGLHDRDIYIRTHTQNFGGGKMMPGSADGSTVPKTGLPYADRHLYLLADGEEVISNRHGQADRWRPFLKAINANRLASGGTTEGGGSGSAAYMFGSLNSLTIRQLELRLKALGFALDDSTKAVDRERQHRDALISRRTDIASTVADSFTSDIFGVTTPGSSNPWAAGARGSKTVNPLDVLRTDIKHTAAYDRLIHRLKGRGLDGDVVSQITDLGSARQANAMSDRQLHNLERLYERRDRMNHASGMDTGNLVVGDQVRESNRHLGHLTSQLSDVKHELRDVKRELAQSRREAAHNARVAAHEAGKGAGDAVNKAARAGNRGGRPTVP